MQINQVVNGFRLDNIQHCKAIKATVYQFVHQKSNAKLIWLDRVDENKTFIIGFNTIPVDSTGVFHILEHSVLNGSERYPLKEPFVDLLKGSLQTFLNAMTYPDKTLYPVSSRNTKDFYNLMRVYLDGVFAPNCIKNPYIFAQEGWHYQINDVKDDIQYKGVVYSEMQGAFASVERRICTTLQNQLFPDNCYGYVSGGDPEHITDLTYQQFVDTYHKYYNPSNSYILLDGSIDIQETLRMINEEYLVKYEPTCCDFYIEDQKAYGNKTIYQKYPLGQDEDDKDKVYMDLGYLVSDYTDRQTNIAFAILSSILTANNQSILTREIVGKGLAEDIDFSICDDLKQSYVEILLINVKDDKTQEILQVITNTLTKLVETGIDKQELTASLNKMEFIIKEKDYGNKPKGLIYGISCLTDWMRGGDPLAALDLEDELAILREKIETNYFESLISRYILNSKHSCCIISSPSKDLKQQQQDEIYKKLDAYKSNLSIEQLYNLLEFNDRFNAFQAKQDSAKAKKTLPTLTLNDIDKQCHQIVNQITTINDVKTIKYNNDTEGIDYVNMYFDISDLTDEQLPLVSIILDLIDQCPTVKHSVNEITCIKRMYLGNFEISINYNNDFHCDRYNIQLQVSFSCLSKNREKSLETVYEILYQSIFNDTNLVLDCLKQSIISMKQDIINNGVKIALLQTLACFSELYSAKEKIEGLSYYYYLKEFINNFNEEKLKDVSDLFEQLFTVNRLTVSVMGDDGDELANKVIARCKNDDRLIGHVYHELLDKQNMAIEVNSDVSFTVCSSDLCKQTRDKIGQIIVANKILSLDYLWSEVRAKNGAYGAGITSTKGIFSFYSYRDPNALKTLHIYKNTPTYLEEFVNSKQALTNYIIGCIGEIDPLLTNSSEMKLGDSHYFKNTSYQDILQLRQQVLDFNKKELNKLIDLYRLASEDNVSCLIANKKVIEKLNDIKIYKL